MGYITFLFCKGAKCVQGGTGEGVVCSCGCSCTANTPMMNDIRATESSRPEIVVLSFEEVLLTLISGLLLSVLLNVLYLKLHFLFGYFL